MNALQKSCRFRLGAGNKRPAGLSLPHGWVPASRRTNAGQRGIGRRHGSLLRRQRFDLAVDVRQFGLTEAVRGVVIEPMANEAIERLVVGLHRGVGKFQGTAHLGRLITVLVRNWRVAA